MAGTRGDGTCLGYTIPRCIEEVWHAERDPDPRPNRTLPGAPSGAPRVTASMTPHTKTKPSVRTTRTRIPLDALPPWGEGGRERDGAIRPAEKSSPGSHRARPVRPLLFATLIPYVAVLVLVTAGVYISWHQGSHGGGLGGAVAGVAFLAAAGVRFALPKQLAGLLASRNRTTDVVTLVSFGAALLLLGLVLPS